MTDEKSMFDSVKNESLSECLKYMFSALSYIYACMRSYVCVSIQNMCPVYITAHKSLLPKHKVYISNIF